MLAGEYVYGSCAGGASVGGCHRRLRVRLEPAAVLRKEVAMLMARMVGSCGEGEQEA